MPQIGPTVMPQTEPAVVSPIEPAAEPAVEPQLELEAMPQIESTTMPQTEIPQVSSSTMLPLHNNLGLLSDSAVLATAPPAKSTEPVAHPMITRSKLKIVKPNPRYSLIVVPSVPHE